MSKRSIHHAPFVVRALAVLALVALPALGCAKKAPALDDSGDGSGDGSNGGAAQGSAATAGSSSSSAAAAPAGASTTPAATTPGTVTPADTSAKPGTNAPDDLVVKLTQALQGVEFFSEGEFPWSVLEADAAGATDVTSKLVADKLGAQIAKLQGGGGRDLSKLPVVTGDSGVAGFLGSMASDPDDPSATKYADVAKLFAANLQSSQVFFFDMDDSGVQVSGPIITVVVGKTAASKLVAVVSFQVST
jgi:hypothetical protein